MKKLVLIIFLISLLSSCNTFPRIESDVTIFHSLDSFNRELTYFFLPADEQERFADYMYLCNIVRPYLTANGYKEVPLEKANILIDISYSMDEGTTNTSSIPTFGQTGVTPSAGNVIGGQPTYGITGSTQHSRTVYTRSFTLSMHNVDDYKNGLYNGIYFGMVISQGSTGQFLKIGGFGTGSIL